MAIHEARHSGSDGRRDSAGDPGLNSNPELTLDVGEQMLERTRTVAREVEDRIRRALDSAESGPDG